MLRWRKRYCVALEDLFFGAFPQNLRDNRFLEKWRILLILTWLDPFYCCILLSTLNFFIVHLFTSIIYYFRIHTCSLTILSPVEGSIFQTLKFRSDQITLKLLFTGVDFSNNPHLLQPRTYFSLENANSSVLVGQRQVCEEFLQKF